jgi:hypothetical protein
MREGLEKVTVREKDKAVIESELNGRKRKRGVKLWIKARNTRFAQKEKESTWVTNLVDNPLSIKLCPLTVTPLTRFPKGMLPTGLSGSWP